MTDEELWAFKDELITEIAEVYARIPSIAHHGEECFRAYAAELVGRCHRLANEKLITNPRNHAAGRHRVGLHRLQAAGDR